MHRYARGLMRCGRPTHGDASLSLSLLPPLSATLTPSLLSRRPHNPAATPLPTAVRHPSSSRALLLLSRPLPPSLAALSAACGLHTYCTAAAQGGGGPGGKASEGKASGAMRGRCAEGGLRTRNGQCASGRNARASLHTHTMHTTHKKWRRGLLARRARVAGASNTWLLPAASRHKTVRGTKK